MSKRDEYAPDYGKLYPGVSITPEIMRVLTGSDRKMKYCEYDLKTERTRKNARTAAVTVYPAREDSLDRLAEENHRHHALEAASPEEALMEQDEIIRLKHALRQLDPGEWELIHALFYDGISERQLSAKTGMPQKTINYRKKKVLLMLRKKILSGR